MPKPATPPGQDPTFTPPGHGGTPPGLAACYAPGTRIAVPLAEVVRRGDVQQLAALDQPAARLLGLGMAFRAG